MWSDAARAASAMARKRRAQDIRAARKLTSRTGVYTAMERNVRTVAAAARIGRDPFRSTLLKLAGVKT